ncbi:hypothetical protein [Nocardia lasii]|uniref:Terpene cyclase/mutase family protein n=1 Tax=Nocardia lasii TaxID=1616107 RepID=A0ABW1JWK5_9NOCA
MRLAVEWVRRYQFSDGAGGAGWGWIHDVPPNPQNTAEIVCALTAAGIPVPRAEEVLHLVRRQMIVPPTAGAGEFTGPIDIAWRLRAMHCLGVADDDPDVRECVRTLLDEQEPESGGFRMSGSVGPVSLTATAAAMHALAPYASADVAVARAALRGVTFLAMTMLSDDVRAEALYTAAHIAGVLARPEYASIVGKRSRRASELAIERLLDGLADRADCNGDEWFLRGDVAHAWRHLGLHTAIGAVLVADAALILHPTVRAALTALFDLQELDHRLPGRGGFRTSSEGFVTAYSTTLAIEAMVYARAAVGETVNPGRIFDLICRADGAHHTDGGVVTEWGKRRLVINSHAGFAMFLLAAAAGLTIVGLGGLLKSQQGPDASLPARASAGGLVVWGTVVLAFGTLAWLTSRFPSTSARAIAAGVFGGFTAVVLPVVTYMV